MSILRDGRLLCKCWQPGCAVVSRAAGARKGRERRGRTEERDITFTRGKDNFDPVSFLVSYLRCLFAALENPSFFAFSSLFITCSSERSECTDRSTDSAFFSSIARFHSSLLSLRCLTDVVLQQSHGILIPDLTSKSSQRSACACLSFCFDPQAVVTLTDLEIVKVCRPEQLDNR